MNQSILEDAELWVDRGSATYSPKEIITGQYNLSSWLEHGLEAIELTLLWYTAGQGEEDFCVHFYDRFEEEGLPRASNPVGRFAVTLPASPPSYQGQIVKVCWAVRLRGFFKGVRQRVVEAPFMLLGSELPSQASTLEGRNADA